MPLGFQYPVNDSNAGNDYIIPVELGLAVQVELK